MSAALVYPHQSRALADFRHRAQWDAARHRKIGASTAAKFSKIESVPRYIASIMNDSFRGNRATAHGNDRERAILSYYGIEQSTILYHAADNPRFVCTPDAVVLGGDGSIVVAQVKTTDHDFRTIPLGYKRQCWWEQMVMGTDRTLFIWEKHTGFVPDQMEPQSIWIERDDTEIDKMVEIANLVLAGMDEYDRFTRENGGPRGQ